MYAQKKNGNAMREKSNEKNRCAVHIDFTGDAAHRKKMRTQNEKQNHATRFVFIIFQFNVINDINIAMLKK